MEIRSAAVAASRSHPLLRALALLLVALGLLGHLYAAHAIGGSRTAYTHHVLGFLLILAVTGGVLAALGWRFWRSRSAVTLLAIGAVQAALGLWIATETLRAAAAP
jgi:cell division protein FtsW (lipid II flippase)